MPENDLLTREETEAEPGRELTQFEAALVPASPALMLQVIAKAAADPRCDVDKMRELLAMQERLIANQARQEFNEAMARLQPKLPRIPKRGKMTRGESGGAIAYPLLEDIDAAIRPLLNEEGFSLSFDTISREQDNWITVVGTLRHRAGHFERSQIGPLPPDVSGKKNPAQALGSSASYGRRYVTANLLNLMFEGEDDNAQAAGGDDFISDSSVAHIGELLKETDSNLTKFLETFRIVEIGEMRQSQFERAVNLLMAKKRRMKDEMERGG